MRRRWEASFEGVSEISSHQSTCGVVGLARLTVFSVLHTVGIRFMRTAFITGQEQASLITLGGDANLTRKNCPPVGNPEVGNPDIHGKK